MYEATFGLLQQDEVFIEAEMIHNSFYNC